MYFVCSQVFDISGASQSTQLPQILSGTVFSIGEIQMVRNHTYCSKKYLIIEIRFLSIFEATVQKLKASNIVRNRSFYSEIQMNRIHMFYSEKIQFLTIFEAMRTFLGPRNFKCLLCAVQYEQSSALLNCI